MEHSKILRDRFAWYFSGTGNRGSNVDTTTRTTEHHGVGMVISNFLEPCIEEVINVSNRIIKVSFRGKQRLCILGAYAPTAAATETEKNKFYRELEACYKKSKHKAATFIFGDFNARILKAQEGEENIIGQHTFDINNTNTETQNEDVADNRERLMELCTKQDLEIMNTTFQQQDKYLATYKE